MRQLLLRILIVITIWYVLDSNENHEWTIVLELVFYFIFCLCSNRSCLRGKELEITKVPLGFAGSLNYVFFVINIFIYISAFRIGGENAGDINITLITWFVINYDDDRQWPIVSTVLIGVIAALYSYDTKILNGEASNF
ncbi:hypothetical protein M3Y95_00833300 [Aphelenchoides besseyi]|nr:hypothetical protein M3Y95_00833300 [Aphelenchoides besseyi]